MRRGNQAQTVKQELHKQKLEHVLNIQKKQMTHNIELAEAQRVVDRKSKEDWMVYNRQMDAKERHKEQLIANKNRNNAAFNNKVDGFVHVSSRGWTNLFVWIAVTCSACRMLQTAVRTN